MLIRLTLLLVAVCLATGSAAATVTITAVGDTMIGSAWPFASELPPADGNNMFAAISSQLGGSDAVFGNLEGVLTDDVTTVRDCPPTSTTCFRFGIPTRYAAHLVRAGFTVLNNANNHGFDFGADGQLSTFKTLQAAGLTGFGTLDHPSATTVTASGVHIAWIGFAPHTGVNPLDIDAMRVQVAALKHDNDMVIVSMHVGAEGAAAQHITRAPEIFLGQNRGDPYTFAHAAIDAGADLVLGHGPHVLRAMEVYKGHLIAYSLGNFATYGRFNLKGPNAVSGLLKVTLGTHGEFAGGRFISTRQERGSAAWLAGTTPVPDDTSGGLNLLRDLSRQDIPESPLQFADDGTLSVPATTSRKQAPATLARLSSIRHKPI